MRVPGFTYEAILSVFSALDKGDITMGQARQVLGHQALRLADEPDKAALSRQAVVEIRQMQRGEHEPMPTPDYDETLLSEVQLTSEGGQWRVFVKYDGQRYGFGTFLHYADAQHACTASALEKALGSLAKRTIRQTGEEPQPAPQTDQVSPVGVK